MSVYKEEAARTVPMENIYIPLSVIPNGADENDLAVSRRNPVEFLAPGTRHVVLGDPGSGKTTLLRFLALFGQSKPLQQRYGSTQQGKRLRFESDERLPILVTLRRYADALRAKDNLSLIDYIRENISADFSIADISTEFLEYYLESGQTILLFDGLDELPNPSFKQKVRNRIHNLTETYPGNTTIVSSRVYGYEGAFRFDDMEFTHHRVAKLRTEEIEQFVRDWYHARIEKLQDQKDYLNSLLGILQNEEHEAIRELARNPLLPTIIVLVHRIDAVLPDERHVLYQKCSETLLNTWHTWKFHEIDRLHRAKVDRLNIQRMQAIAYWMQHQMGSTTTGQQAVVPYEALHKLLSEHITGETPPNPDYAPEDIATAFIEFVQDRAGLLIKIGDQEFSFVHLTFQEYLTAAHIRTLSELNGVKEAWSNEIKDQCPDPRWREVLRLLVAGYGSNASQEFLVEHMLAVQPVNTTNAQLLGGLLLDGVAAAEMKKQEVFEQLLLASSKADDENELRNTLAILRACCGKVDADRQTLKDATRSLVDESSNKERLTRLRLTVLATGMDLEETWGLCRRGSKREAAILSLFSGGTLTPKETQALSNDLRLLWAVTDSSLLDAPYGNFYAAVFQRLAEGVSPHSGSQRAFEVLLTGLCMFETLIGPIPYLISYLFLFSRTDSLIEFGLNMARDRDQDRILARARARARALALSRPLSRPLSRIRDQDRILARARALDRALSRPRAPSVASSESASVTWQQLSSNPDLSAPLLQLLCEIFALIPTALWHEALRVAFLPTVPERIRLVDPQCWEETRDAFVTGERTEADIYAAASQLVLDGLLYIIGYHEPDADWLREVLHYEDDKIAELQHAATESRALFAELADQTRNRGEAPLRVAHCMRDLAYGDKSRTDDLKAMVESNDPAYQEIFERCYWRPTEEERKREEAEEKRKYEKAQEADQSR